MTPDLDGIARGVVGTVADSALRAAALALLTAAAVVIFRRKRASLRIGTWTVLLYGALALPVLGLVLPAWRWTAPTIQLVGELGTTATASPVSESVATPALLSAASYGASASWWTIAAGIYIAGVVLFILRAGIGWLTTRHLRARAAGIRDANALSILARHSSAAGLTTAPRLLESAHLFVPVTMSVLRPIVVLPQDWREWPAGRLEAVLAHEVAHVARRDALTQRISLFYRAAVWFSPLSWWLHRHISDLADEACDEAALETGIDRTTYAAALLEFFGRLHDKPQRADWHLAMARRADADAGKRVERILSWKGGSMMTRSKLLLTVVAVAAVPVVAVTASVSVTPEVVRFAIPVVADRPVGFPSQSSSIMSGAAALRAALTTPAAQTAQARPVAPPTAAVPAPSQQYDLQVVDDFAKGAYESDAPGVVAPRVRLGPMPKYTPDAMRAKIQGRVVVEVIVAPDGTVAKARLKPTPEGQSMLGWRVDGTGDVVAAIKQLIESAIETAKKWTFEPGKLNGDPVPVRAVIELEFRLH